jgi:hypothetical protein
MSETDYRNDGVCNLKLYNQGACSKVPIKVFANKEANTSSPAEEKS